MPNSMWNGNYGDAESKRRKQYGKSSPMPRPRPSEDQIEAKSGEVPGAQTIDEWRRGQ